MLIGHCPTVYAILFDGAGRNGLLTAGEAFGKFTREVCRVIDVVVRTGFNHFEEVELPFLEEDLVDFVPPIRNLHCGRFHQWGPGAHRGSS